MRNLLFFLIIVLLGSRIEMQATTIIFVKSGPTEYSSLGKWQGQETDLSLKDPKSAADLACKLAKKSYAFDFVFSDSLKRSYETAVGILAKYPEAKWLEDKRLLVRKITPFEEKQLSQVLDIYKEKTNTEKNLSADEIFEKKDWIENVESNEDLLNRMLDFIKSMEKVDSKCQSILAVTHTDNIRVLWRYLNGLNADADFKVQATAILELKVENGEITIQSYSDIDKRTKVLN